MKFYPYEKGVGKSFRHAECVCVWGGGGCTNSFGVVFKQ